MCYFWRWLIESLLVCVNNHNLGVSALSCEYIHYSHFQQLSSQWTLKFFVSHACHSGCHLHTNIVLPWLSRCQQKDFTWQCWHFHILTNVWQPINTVIITINSTYFPTVVVVLLNNTIIPCIDAGKWNQKRQSIYRIRPSYQWLLPRYWWKLEHKWFLTPQLWKALEVNIIKKLLKI